MTTATAEEEISVDPSNEEPASKKIRLDNEPSSSSDAANTSKDDPTDQTTDNPSPTKVQKIVVEIYVKICSLVCRKPWHDE